jgi:hypothetical protein
MVVPGVSLNLDSVNADRSAATTHFIGDRQAPRLVLTKFPSSVFDRFIRAATSGHGLHDVLHANFGSPLVISRDATAHVALRDDADKLEVICILNHWGASAT